MTFLHSKNCKWAKILGTCFLGNLEQKVKHIFAPKLVTDKESSIYKFGRGTLVISVFVYCIAQPAHHGAL